MVRQLIVIGVLLSGQVGSWNGSTLPWVRLKRKIDDFLFIHLRVEHRPVEVFPVARYKQAFRHLRHAAHIGKVVVSLGEDG